MAPINRCPDWGLRILLCINWVLGPILVIFMSGGPFQFYMRACKQILIYLGGGNGPETVQKR